MTLCVALLLPAVPMEAAVSGEDESTAGQELVVDVKAKDVSGNATLKSYKYTYTGKAIKPKVKVSEFATGKPPYFCVQVTVFTLPSDCVCFFSCYLSGRNGKG